MGGRSLGFKGERLKAESKYSSKLKVGSGDFRMDEGRRKRGDGREARDDGRGKLDENRV